MNVAFTAVSVATRLLTCTLLPNPLTALVPDRPWPVNVTLTVEPRPPDAGLIEATVGGRILNTREFVFPPEVARLTE